MLRKTTIFVSRFHDKNLFHVFSPLAGKNLAVEEKLTAECDTVNKTFANPYLLCQKIKFEGKNYVGLSIGKKCGNFRTKEGEHKSISSLSHVCLMRW